MRRILLSAFAALALAVSVGFVSPVLAAVGMVDPHYETYSVFGKPKQVTVVRVTLEELYGFSPLGFGPVSASLDRPRTRNLPLINPGPPISFVRKATLYWKYDKDRDLYVPKVSLTMYDYATADYLRNPAKNPSGTLPVGILNPAGKPFVNPVTNEPIGTVSPTITGFATYSS